MNRLNKKYVEQIYLFVLRDGCGVRIKDAEIQLTRAVKILYRWNGKIVINCGYGRV